MKHDGVHVGGRSGRIRVFNDLVCKSFMDVKITVGSYVFFFFQAEDGIRDYKVTGVQTCALPIFGIRGFNPKLKKAAERLEGLRTPEGEPIPPNTLSELHRDMERRRLVRDQIRQIESARLDHLEHEPGEGAHAMVRLLARVMGIGIETADMLVHEVLSRNLRDRRAVARYAGLTGSPDESGKKRREKGLARSGNPRVRRGVVPIAA